MRQSKPFNREDRLSRAESSHGIGIASKGF
jgi:hypothetical protein